MAVNERLDRLSGNTESWRNILAVIVFTVSALGVTILAILIVQSHDGSITDKKDIFNILVPVLSTWVGTILAFYFAKDNFEAATRNAQRIVSQLTPEQRLQQIGVRTAMLSKENIRSISLDGNGDAGLSVAAIISRVEAGSSRVPILSADGSIKYVLRDTHVYGSMNRAFRAAKDMAASAVAAGQGMRTLADLLAEPIDDKGKSATIGDLAKRFAIVRIDANLAEARVALLAVEGARDVFVTATGRASEPILGWLTNYDITREVTVS
ncbi:hypothetical protein ASG43_06825 [Aureimonas sp. Leaf454]|nr:hypothetical protein ASG43_06825 [Aureimonas sp. Leaf454]